MCLYPRLADNPKYKPNKKNGGRPPICKDKRLSKIPIPCGKCMECQKQRGRAWKIRLMEEIQDHAQDEKHFVTLTFNNKSIIELNNEIHPDIKGYERDNAIAKLGLRRFLERWRAKYGTSIRHWMTTELGHNGTENIHMHGIIFVKKTTKVWNRPKTRQIDVNITKQEIAKVWKYGYVWTGTYVNEATVNYIIKYCTKMDQHHREYKPQILSTPGIGNRYTTSINAKRNYYKPGTTNELYTTRQGTRMNLPTYYRNKLYTEEQREKLWLEKIEKQERWVDGSRVSIAHGDQEYYQVLKWAREKNQRMGYGTDEKNWDQNTYENERRDALLKERTTTDTPNMGAPDTEKLDRRREGDINKQFEKLRERLRAMAPRPTAKTWRDIEDELPEK